MRHARTTLSACLTLVTLAVTSGAAAAPAPGPTDPGRILVNGVSDGEYVTYAMDPADGAVGDLVAGGEDAVYSPNGAWVVYSHDADPCTGYPICSSSPDLWLSNTKGTSEKFLVEAQEGEMGEARNVRPDWSPDGTRILFQYPGGAAWVRPDGSDLELLASVGGYATFSPDGTKIAGMRGARRSVEGITDRGVEIRITDVATLETTLLATDWSGDLDGLDWSPDGERIVYSGEDGLRVIDPASGENRDLLPGTGLTQVQTPVFSPDGGQVAFSARSRETDTAHIYVVNADGTGLRSIADRGGSLSDWVA